MKRATESRRKTLRPQLFEHRDGSKVETKRSSSGDRYELVASGERAAVENGEARTPKIHSLVQEYDTRGLRAYLKANPEELHRENASGDTPLHVVASRGAVLVAEALDELGPDHLRSNRRGLLPGHLAIENHPRTAQFLFERALASEAVDPRWRTPDEIEKKIAGVLKDPTPKAIDSAAASLCGISVSELNSPGQVVKNRTHLEAVKGKILDVKSEGWWQASFVPQRVRSLLSAIVAADRGEAEGAPEGTKQVLAREVGTQLDLLRTIRRVGETKDCPNEEIRRMSMTLEARQVAARIDGCKPGEETALALGWTGHAIYGGFIKVRANPEKGHPKDTLLIRIDNLGAGATKGHEKNEEGLVHSRAIHVPLDYLRTEEGRARFEEMLADILLVKGTPDSEEDDFYARLARFKRDLKEATQDADLVESRYGVPEERALPKQIAGNCVVENTFPGLESRLGRTFDWFSDYEYKLARELVAAHADTNKLIDEECRERDMREIDKLLDTDGPWAERLQEIVDGARDTYGASGLTEDVTAEQMKAVVEAGDLKTLKILVAHGAKVDLQDEHDATPLHWAAERGDAAAVEFLLRHEAAVNAMDDDGNTPLHHALRGGSHAVVALLLENGADADRENKAGVTPRAEINDRLEQLGMIAHALDGPRVVELPRGARRKSRPFAKAARG